MPTGRLAHPQTTLPRTGENPNRPAVQRAPQQNGRGREEPRLPIPNASASPLSQPQTLFDRNLSTECLQITRSTKRIIKKSQISVQTHTQRSRQSTNLKLRLLPHIKQHMFRPGLHNIPIRLQQSGSQSKAGFSRSAQKRTNTTHIPDRIRVPLRIGCGGLQPVIYSFRGREQEEKQRGKRTLSVAAEPQNWT